MYNHTRNALIPAGCVCRGPCEQVQWQSRLKAGMQVGGVERHYLKLWRQECVWLRTLCFFLPEGDLI